jgi:NAD(P)-dependent dehydrogenase (short-subunit alcohol dehydrogenase family)
MEKVIVVTGASSGVGRATARRFGAEGARVALLARGEAGLEAAAAEIRRCGGTALPIPVDVADAAAVEAAAERIERELGPIDVWINNAMTTVFGPVDRITAEEFRRVTEVTYLGYVHGTMAALRRMRRRDRGVIVQVGSALSYRAIPLQAAYCGAKFAIRGFTDSLRTELIHDGSAVHLAMVQLPAVDTPQFDWCRNKMERRARPVAPIYDPELAAEAIAFAAAARRREVWVGRSAVSAILGNKIAPGVLDRILAARAVEGQMGRAPNAQQRDNLFAPVPGDRGARGRFGAETRRSSWSFWMSRHRAVLAPAALLAAAGLSLALRRRAARPSLPRA